MELGDLDDHRVFTAAVAIVGGRDSDIEIRIPVWSGVSPPASRRSIEKARALSPAHDYAQAADVAEGQSRRRCRASGALDWRCTYRNRDRSPAVARTPAAIMGLSGPREPVGICKGALASAGRTGHSLGFGDPRGSRQAGGAAHDS